MIFWGWNGLNILRQPHVKMSTNSTFLLPRAADPTDAYGLLLCSSVSSHSAAFRIEAVACLWPACLVSKEGNIFRTTPAGYKPNVKPRWHDKIASVYNTNFPGMLLFVERVWRCNSPWWPFKSVKLDSDTTAPTCRALPRNSSAQRAMPVIGMCHNIKNTGIEGAKLNAKDCHIQELFEKANRSAIWAALHAKDTVTRFGSEAFADGKFDVLPCKHSNPTLLWTLNWYLNSARAFLAAGVLPTGLSQLRHQRQLFEKAIPISVDSNLCLHDGHKTRPRNKCHICRANILALPRFLNLLSKLRLNIMYHVLWTV